MNKFLITVNLVIWLFAGVQVSSYAAEPAKKSTAQNCVKKNKKGECPPTPKSPKPTPKKKAETPK